MTIYTYYFEVNCSNSKLDPLQIWQNARNVRTNLALCQICILFFLAPVKVYKFGTCLICKFKFGTLPNLYTFLRPRQYLGTINFCVYKFGTLPNLSTQN